MSLKIIFNKLLNIMIFNIKDKFVSINNIALNINIKITEDTPEEPNEKYGFNNQLNIYRNRIDKINPDVWKKVRWYINNYDFLVQDPIINRAFYKYWEIINVFNIFDDYNENDNMFHCAEAPGGFIQGSNIFLQLEQNNNINKIAKTNLVDEDGFTIVKKKKEIVKQYKIYSISLNKDLQKYKNYNLPSYNKRVINPNVLISYGIDNTGDINNINNIYYFKNIMPKDNNSCYLITADGGFDEGIDFNNKEQLHFLLILNEIIATLILQKDNGHFILKMFDIFTNTSVHLLYLLSLLYKEIYVYKPKTSRPTNSEKYIICKYFECNNEKKLDIIKKLIELSTNINLLNKNYSSFSLFESDCISNDFINKIKNMNDYLINNQCNSLNKSILLCEDTDFIKNYDNELNKSLEKRKQIFNEWGKKYNLNNFIPLN